MKIEIDTEASARQFSMWQERMVTPAPKVLFVSSSDITAPMINSFSNGAAYVGVVLATTIKANLGYLSGSTTAIEQYLTNNAGPYSLIVTAGGLITHTAAHNSSASHRKNWIALLGAVPTASPPDSFLGGVLLDSYNANRERYLLLRSKGIAANQIGLYVNQNSAMSAQEIQSWQTMTGNTNIFRASRNNDAVQYQTDLTAGNLGAVRGLVVSGDPFFAQTRGALISAANAWLGGDANRQICYPHQIYANKNAPVAQQPANQSMLYGPAPADTYGLLGQLAAAAINQKTAQQFLGYWPVKDRLTIVGMT